MGEMPFRSPIRWRVVNKLGCAELFGSLS